MKLEVGKQYRCRDGSGPVKIVNYDEDKWPFNADNGHCYDIEGNMFNEHEYHRKDLVAEWVESETRDKTPEEIDAIACPTGPDDYYGASMIEIAKNPKAAYVSKPEWYWGFWEYCYKAALDRFNDMNIPCFTAWEAEQFAHFADAACAERMKREVE